MADGKDINVPIDLKDLMYSDSDPFGMYTGRPKDPDDEPMQDADDE